MKCPVCNFLLDQGPTEIGGMNIMFGCPRCGPFILTREASDDLSSYLRNNKQRAALSYAIRRAERSTDENRPITGDQVRKIIDRCALPSAHEQADNLIRWIGDSSEGPGVRTRLTPGEHGAIAGSLLDVEAFGYLLDQMCREDLLDGPIGSWKEPDGPTYSSAASNTRLSFKGWARYQDLKKGSFSGNFAFMAMQYGDAVLDGVVDDYFRPAVKSVGFDDLRRLDDDPKAGLIDDRLRVEIRACRLFIADLTHANRGAYWEAGYAEGLDKPVIYTCEKKVFDNPSHKNHPHFDTNHYTTVIWSFDKIDAAVESLKVTIQATLPEIGL